MHLQSPPLGVGLDWSNPLNDELVMHIAMNEGHGDRVYDLSGYGNHGVTGGMAYPPTVDSGWGGRGMNCDGVDDYINCGNDDSLNITDAITISAWIYPEAYPNYILSKNNLDAWDNQYGILLHSTYHNIVYYPTSSLESATDSISLNVWTHITLTRNSAGIGQFYINGVASGNPLAISMPTKPTFPVRLGCRWDDGNPHPSFMFNGSIADVRIYNRALGEDEISLLYNSYRPKLVAFNTP